MKTAEVSIKIHGLIKLIKIKRLNLGPRGA